MSELNNYEDVIDSRDVIGRIEELQGLDSRSKEEDEELNSLESLANEASGYAPDWEYGEALIRESYFTEYAIDMLKDCGDLPDNIPWYIEIDEEATASNIMQDYTAVDFDSVTYYIR